MKSIYLSVFSAIILFNSCLLQSQNKIKHEKKIALPHNIGFIKNMDNNTFLIICFDAMLRQNHFYYYEKTTGKVAKKQLPDKYLSKPLIDMADTGGFTYFLFQDAMEKYHIDIAKNPYDNENLQIEKTLVYHLDYRPVRMFITNNQNDIVFVKPSFGKREDRYHFQRFNNDGEFITQFAPIIPLDESIPFFSPYYLADTEYCEGSFFIVYSAFLPNIYLYDENTMELCAELTIEGFQADSHISHDPSIDFSMKIPKHRLLGKPAAEPGGRLWIPANQVVNDKITAKILVMFYGIIEKEFTIKDVLIHGIELSADKKKLYVWSKDQFIVYNLE